MRLEFGSVVLAALLLVAGCGDDSSMMEDASLPDGAAPDAGGDSSVSPDGAVDGGPTDSAAGDAGDAGDPDGAVDSGSPPPPPAAPTLFASTHPVLLRGAEALGAGVVAVGTTRNDAIPGESREAWAFHYGDDGTVSWAQTVGDASNDQFLDVARSGSSVVMAGVTRGYSVGSANNNDVLLVRATASGPGAAFNWGTTADELLYGLADGGSVAAFVGVGEYRSGGGMRQGLVVAFGEDLAPLWATTVDAGDDDRFYDAVVIGTTVYAVGQSGDDLLIVALNDSGMLWARRTAGAPTLGSAATMATDIGGQLVVTGSLPNAGSTRVDPVVLRFGADGTLMNGARFDVGTAAGGTNVRRVGGATVVTAVRWSDRTPLLFTVGATVAAGASDALAISGTQTAGFLRTPIVETAGGARLVLLDTTEKVVDMPFNTVPEAGCSETPITVAASSVAAAEIMSATVSAGALTLTGGAISGIRTGPLGTGGAAFTCPAP